MPPTAATLRVGRYFLSLGLLLVALFGLVYLPGQRHTPKLGLDLEGGAQVILKASTENGKLPSKSSMKIAREILTQRVNGAGVTAAEVVQEGDDRIVISVPGKSATELAQIGKAAVLNFRPVVMPAVTGSTSVPTSSTTGSSAPTGTSPPSGTTTGSATPTTSTPSTSSTATTTTTPKPTSTSNGLLAPLGIAPTTAAKKTPATKAPAKKAPAKTPTPTPSATPTSTAPVAESQNPFAGLGFPLPTSDTAFTALPAAQQQQLTTALGNFKCGSKPPDNPKADLAACDVGGSPKYLLGPVIVAGREISSAAAVAPNSTDFRWSISIDLKASGQTEWANYTQAHHSSNSPDNPTTCSTATTPCAEFVAFTLDGDVISAPHNEATINGTTSVTGQYTQSSAQQLANQLRYGALPLSFDTLTTQNVSATLGTSQLKAGLLAGGIGLALVVLYSLLYYRGLGLITIASLLVSGALTYACLVILGREIGFTLTLAGIAGFIVAVGITADSFVVFFERLKDEVHSGRSIRVAVPRAWSRARRTILSADTVSFLAAAVLYYFAAGDVRGFAFTLGLSTILDLVVVFLFTHPIVSLLSRNRAFGSPRFTGLNSVGVSGPGPGPGVASGPGRAVRAAAPARGRTATAVLDPDTDGDLLELGFEDEPITTTTAPIRAPSAAMGVEEVADPGASADAGPVADSGGPRSRRITRRAAPGAEIGEDAAERAARRRGRSARPPRPMAADEDLASVEYAEADPDAATASAAHAPGEIVAADTVPAGEDARTAESPRAGAGIGGASTPAARAAARRARDRAQIVDPGVTPEPMIGRRPATPERVVESEPVTASEPVVDEPRPAPETAQVGTSAPGVPTATQPATPNPPVLSAAAERAAARRSRIRSRGGPAPEHDLEDGA